eukprot:GHVT01048103.1.p1 GENE.GHVT01048103.1~~GHVT01048103.1.p1  ORF type:complete len:668 (+),score=101.83 GHVT01048103.1:223-2226(+)
MRAKEGLAFALLWLLPHTCTALPPEDPTLGIDFDALQNFENDKTNQLVERPATAASTSYGAKQSSAFAPHIAESNSLSREASEYSGHSTNPQVEGNSDEFGKIGDSEQSNFSATALPDTALQTAPVEFGRFPTLTAHSPRGGGWTQSETKSTRPKKAPMKKAKIIGVAALIITAFATVAGTALAIYFGIKSEDRGSAAPKNTDGQTMSSSKPSYATSEKTDGRTSPFLESSSATSEKTPGNNSSPSKPSPATPKETNGKTLFLSGSSSKAPKNTGGQTLSSSQLSSATFGKPDSRTSPFLKSSSATSEKTPGNNSSPSKPSPATAKRTNGQMSSPKSSSGFLGNIDDHDSPSKLSSATSTSTDGQTLSPLLSSGPSMTTDGNYSSSSGVSSPQPLQSTGAATQGGSKGNENKPDLAFVNALKSETPQKETSNKAEDQYTASPQNSNLENPFPAEQDSVALENDPQKQNLTLVAESSTNQISENETARGSSQPVPVVEKPAVQSNQNANRLVNVTKLKPDPVDSKVEYDKFRRPILDWSDWENVIAKIRKIKFICMGTFFKNYVKVHRESEPQPETDTDSKPKPNTVSQPKPDTVSEPEFDFSRFHTSIDFYKSGGVTACWKEYWNMEEEFGKVSVYLCWEYGLARLKTLNDDKEKPVELEDDIIVSN